MIIGLSLRSQNVFPSSGNVGIGTSSPQYLLDVANNSRVSGSLLLEQPGTRGFLRIKPPAGTKTTRVIDFFEDADPAASAYGVIGITNEAWGAPVPSFSIISSRNSPGGPTKDIMIWANDAPSATNAAMTIKANSGNIGIGVSDPQYKLAVYGTIGATKVKVTQSGWPDYVFSDGYRLPSLAEVEAFIKEQKHLPQVPSATEVEKNGLDLGDNQAILLKKIEELTLYLIEQDKALKQKQEKIEQLTKKMSSFEQRLTQLEKDSLTKP